MFENVDGRTDGRTTEGRWLRDAGVTGILIAHLGAFGSGELKRSTALERSVKYFTGGLKPVSRCQPHPQFRCGSRHIDIWFA